MTTEIAVACTLSPADYRRRLEEVRGLSRDALLRVERRGLTLDLRYAPKAAASVRQLVEQEHTCCAFLHFELYEDRDEVRLLVTVPAAAAEAVPELLAELTGERYGHH